AGLPIAWDLQIELARVGHDRLAAIPVTAVAGLPFAREVVIHLGIQRALGERLLQIVEKTVRIKGCLRIGTSQKLVQDGIRDTRFFASWHAGAPFHPSCPPKHEIPDSSRGRGFCTDQSIALSASQPRWGKTSASPSSPAIQAAT